MSPETLLALLIGFKYLALYILVIFEGFFATIAAGALSAQNILNIYAAVVVVIAGDMTSDYIFYTFGKRISRSRFAKFFSLSSTQIHRVERIFTRFGKKTIIIAKLSSYLAIPVIVAAGAVHMPKRTFYAYCAVAAVLKASVFIMLGYLFGKEIHNVVNAAIIVSIGASIVVLSYWVGSHILHIQSQKRQNDK